MFIKASLYLLIVYHIIWSVDCCITFNNNIITVTERNGNKFNGSISGCLQRISFDGKAVTEVLIRNQNIPIFYEDTIRHLGQLQKLSVWKCRLNEIKPRAFRNLPRLEHLYVTYSNISGIFNEVFNLVPSLIQVRLHNNIITRIDDEAFNNLPKLKRLNMSNNLLTRWKKEWFKNTTAIEMIDFSYNKIGDLPNGAFGDLHKLREIYFDHNDITSIGRDIFEGIVLLQYLGFSHNKIKVINSRAFPNEIRINSLHVEANYFSFVPQEVLNKMDVGEVALYGNPFNCLCFDRFMKWITTNQIRILKNDVCDRHDLPICVVSNDLVDRNCTILNETADLERYLNVFRNSSPPIDPSCARLD